jgi:hypothetical protein
MEHLREMREKHILCVKDYYDGSGKKILEAGRIYPGQEQYTAQADYRMTEFLRPVSVRSPAGRIWVSRQKAEECLRKDITADGFFYMHYCLGNIRLILEQEESGLRAGFVSEHGKLLFPFPADWMNGDPEESGPENPYFLRLLCSGAKNRMGCAFPDERRPMMAFLKDLLDLEEARLVDSDAEYDPFSHAIRTELYQLEGQEARAEMIKKGIQPELAVQALYREFLDTGTFPQGILDWMELMQEEEGLEEMPGLERG